MFACCRKEACYALTDIIADSGRPIRLRFSASSDEDSREVELAVCMNMQQAVQQLKDVHDSQGSGKPAQHLGACQDISNKPVSKVIIGCVLALQLCTY